MNNKKELLNKIINIKELIYTIESNIEIEPIQATKVLSQLEELEELINK